MFLLRAQTLPALAIAVAMLGAGCLPETVVPRVAEPFLTTTAGVTARVRGFGTLPTIPIPSNRITITGAPTLPLLPDRVIVLRPRRGTPNDTEFRNLANLLGISDGFIGAHADVTTLDLAWEGSGYRWSYQGAGRLLEFVNDHAPTEPVTLSKLPPNDVVTHLANVFLLERGINPAQFRDPIVEPDWNAWILDAEARRLCVDPTTRATIRALAASAPSQIGVPPSLREASTTRCVSPEFPARITVRYRALQDGRDVLKPDGGFVNGAEITIDVSRHSILSGRIILPMDPERSEYPTRKKSDIYKGLENGGVNGATGHITIRSYDFASLRFSSYLIPSLIAIGTRTKSDGREEPARIIVPLTAE